MLDDLRNLLDEKDEVREAALKEAREIRRLSTDAISSIHAGNYDDAEEKLDRAATRLRDVKSRLEPHPDLRYSGFLKTPMKEHAEAHALLGILRDDALPGPDEVGVDPEQYLQGIGETVGELRRQALDHLIADEPEEAEKLLTAMDHILDILEGFENYPSKVLDIRRTRDLARTLVDKTRGAVARGLVDQRLERKLDEASR